MRTSNKLILGFLILTFGTFTAVYVALGNKFHKGEFTPATQLHSEEFTPVPITTPRVVSFEGTIWVNLIPSDSFALELPRINIDPDAGLFDNGTRVKLRNAHDDKAVTCQQSNDTLYVTGNTTIPIHRPFTEWFYRRGIPQVNFYAPNFGNILLNHGQICLRGTKPVHASLTISNSTLWIGMHYEHPNLNLTENFDSLTINSKNSITVLNTAANIAHLAADLKDSSVITDQYSTLHNAVITATTTSRIDLSGRSIQKTQITIH